MATSRTVAAVPSGPAARHRAASTDHVRQAVSDARRRGARIEVVSSKQSADKRSTGAEILDLSGMDGILGVDPRDKIAILQAGVSFGQASEALISHGLRLVTPLCPMAGKSVLASHLDREPTLNVREQWDVTDPFGSTEMVLGTGDKWNTGNGFPASFSEQWEAGHRFLNSLGPAGVDFLRVIQGAQGGLGVLCWAAVMCQPAPVLEEAWVVVSDTPEPLMDVAAAMARRRMGDAMFVGNAQLFAAMLSSTAEAGQGLAATLPPWALMVSIVGGTEFPEEVIAYERLELNRAAEAAGVSMMDALGGRSALELAAISRKPHAQDFRERVSADHERLFFLSQLTRASELVRLADAWPRKPAVYVQPRLQGRNCHIEFVLPGGANDRAAVTALAERCAAAGGYFSRPAPAWEHVSRAANPSILPYLRQTQSILDPDSVLRSRSGWATWDTAVSSAS